MMKDSETGCWVEAPLDRKLNSVFHRLFNRKPSQSEPQVIDGEVKGTAQVQGSIVSLGGQSDWTEGKAPAPGSFGLLDNQDLLPTEGIPLFQDGWGHGCTGNPYVDAHLPGSASATAAYSQQGRTESPCHGSALTMESAPRPERQMAHNDHAATAKRPSFDRSTGTRSVLASQLPSVPEGTMAPNVEASYDPEESPMNSMAPVSEASLDAYSASRYLQVKITQAYPEAVAAMMNTLGKSKPVATLRSIMVSATIPHAATNDGFRIADELERQFLLRQQLQPTGAPHMQHAEANEGSGGFDAFQQSKRSELSDLSMSSVSRLSDRASDDAQGSTRTSMSCDTVGTFFFPSDLELLLDV